MKRNMGHTILPYPRSLIISYVARIAVIVPLMLALIISLVSLYERVIPTTHHFGRNENLTRPLVPQS